MLLYDCRCSSLRVGSCVRATALAPVFTSYDTVKLAEGIYAFISPEATGGFVSGNSVLNVGADATLVVDSGHVPSVTKRMIADITRLTNKPVRFLVNTRWHPDHVSGNSLYRDQWPGVAIVSTPATQFELTRPKPLYDDLTGMSKYMPMLEQALASGKGQGGKPLSEGERAYYTEVPTEAEFRYPELKQTPHAAPTP
jgi:cyclase